MQRDRLLLARDHRLDRADRRVDRRPGVREIDLDRNRHGEMRSFGTSPCSARRSVRSPTTTDAPRPWTWAPPVRMRNRIVHGYWSIDIDVLAATANDDLPGFLAAVREIESPVTPHTDDP